MTSLRFCYFLAMKKWVPHEYRFGLLFSCIGHPDTVIGRPLSDGGTGAHSTRGGRHSLAHAAAEMEIAKGVAYLKYVCVWPLLLLMMMMRVSHSQMQFNQ